MVVTLPTRPHIPTLREGQAHTLLASVPRSAHFLNSALTAGGSACTAPAAGESPAHVSLDTSYSAGRICPRTNNYYHLELAEALSALKMPHKHMLIDQTCQLQIFSLYLPTLWVFIQVTPVLHTALPAWTLSWEADKSSGNPSLLLATWNPRLPLAEPQRSPVSRTFGEAEIIYMEF